MITINQGKPSSPYFSIIQTEDAGLLKIGKSVTCIHPRKKIQTLGRVVDVATLLWSELGDMHSRNLFGANAQTVREGFCKTLPEGQICDRIKIYQLLDLNYE